MNKTEKAESIRQDGMPPEVATSMLTEPKAKLSNRMRKNCRAAREKFYPSTSPIVHPKKLVFEGDMNEMNDLTSKLHPLGFHYTGTVAKTPEAHITARCSRASWAQLLKWLKRTIARRADVQAKYLKATARLEQLNALKKEETTYDQMRVIAHLIVRARALAMAAEQLDLAWGVLEDVLKNRKMSGPHKSPIDPAIIRRVQLRLVAGIEQ